MNPLFQTLATLYRKSALRKRDFIIDYEKFLRAAGAADGDARELAEIELRQAERESDGCLRIDRHPKSALPLSIRLALDDGEEWLFSKIERPTPTREREDLADFFELASKLPIPLQWTAAWNTWCASLATRARAGSSVQPFSSINNEELMTALTGVLNWQGESLIRYASARICGDSKQLQALEGRLATALSEITGEGSLEAFGILHKPRSVMLHGPLALKIGNDSWDFSGLPGSITLSESNLIPASITTTATLCLSVENEDVFMELAKSNSRVLLIQTSFAGSAVRRLIQALPKMSFFHFGDSDPAGFDILRDLREKTGRDFRPILMDHRPSEPPVPFSKQELDTLLRLISNPVMNDLRDKLESILETGDKGCFEQESIPIEKILEFLESCARGIED